MFLISVIFTFVLLHTACSQSCSEANRANNLEACLSDIRTRAQDNQRYWFGSSFNDRCPNGRVATDPECAIFNGLQIPQSIGSLIYPDRDFDFNQLDRYLSVKYTSTPGNYTGCDNEFVFKNTLHFTADPVSMETIKCWDVRDIPEITWRSENGQFYSLVVVDAAYNVNHGMYVNILGNDISNADAIKPYAGPKHPSRFGNVYVFLLFKQNGRVVPNLKYDTIGAVAFNLTEFNNLQNSTGLVAMNWILAAGDPYTIGRQRERGLVDNCPSFVADEIKTQGRSFIPESPKFEVGVYLKYSAAAIHYTSCCKSYRLEAKNFTVNPLGDSWVKTGHVRNIPEVKLIRTVLNFNPATGFEGKRYTLMMLDPADQLLRFSTADDPFLYWMVSNITGGDVTSGDTILPYLAIQPFDDIDHQYHFLLYEQSGNIIGNSLIQYTSADCPGAVSLRCRFRVTKFVEDNSLKLVGATWMRSKNDDFVPYTRVEYGAPEAVACARVPGYIAGCGACSELNRQTDLQSCLSGIGSLAQDTVRYFFGSSYNDRCPNGNVPTETECTKPSSYEIPQSIISLTYPPGDFNPTTLDRFLEVKYTSVPGSFSSCGNEYHTETTTHFTANPLSMETIDTWDARDEPEFSWRTDPNQLYSLVMYDVGFQFMHACYVNIEGNDVANSDVVRSYVGSGTILRVGGVYVFYLFKQESRTQPDPKFSNRTYVFNMTEFMQLQKLTGPVAMNWILAKHDPYAAYQLRRRRDTCPTFVAEAIVDPPRPYIPEDPKFDVGVYVTYRSSQFRYTSCCTQHLIPASDISLNPLGHGLVKPGDARLAPQIRLSRTILFFDPETGFNDKVYTLMLVDADIVNPEFGTSEKPFIHWLVTNIRNGIVTNGDEILSYLLPAPFNDADHYYYFLLYEQTGTINLTAPAEFTSDACTGMDANRCLFNVTKYVSTNDLKLVGASWMVSRKDEYVRYFAVSIGSQESEVCEGVAGYSVGCNGNGSQNLPLSVLTLFSGFILGLMLH